MSVFDSRIENFLTAESASDPGRIDILNASGPYKVAGAEMLMGWTRGPAHILANATFLDVTEQPPGLSRRTAELIPRVTAELAAIFEDEDLGRVGFELGYTGEQALHDDPYRSRAPSMIELNVLGELNLGEWRVFFNALNLTDEKQSDFDPLLRPALEPGLGGAPNTDAWGPQVGRVFSVGVRVEL